MPSLPVQALHAVEGVLLDDSASAVALEIALSKLQPAGPDALAAWLHEAPAFEAQLREKINARSARSVGAAASGSMPRSRRLSVQETRARFEALPKGHHAI